MDKDTNSSQSTLMNDGLTMTVHSLPASAGLLDPAQTSAGRRRMLFVLLICAAPIIASYLTYYWIRPSSIRSYGDLIQPVRALPDVQAQTLSGQSKSLLSLREQWLLISVAPAACAASCQENLYIQRQIRAALGRERERTEWVWLITDDGPVAEALQAGMRDAQVLRVKHEVLQQWLLPAPGAKIEDHLYVVDPMGNLMLRFPPHLGREQAQRARKDLEKLLRASNSWDKPGR